VVTVVHDLDLARRYFPQALLVRASLIAAGPTAEVLSARNLTRAYGASYAAERSMVTVPKPAPAPALGLSLKDPRVKQMVRKEIP